MIVFIKGLLTLKMPTWVEVDVNGVGYGINIPISTYDKLPEIGSFVFLHTFHYVREDILALYGFNTKSEKEMFSLLLKVSGIGPKVSIAILSTLNENQLHNAIINEETSIISSVPGIGKKTAERLIVELKDKMHKKRFSTKETYNDSLSKRDIVLEDAISALITLGYNLSESRKVVTKLCEHNKEITLENCIREGLKLLKK